MIPTWYTGVGKVGLQLSVDETQSLLLYYLFIIVFIIFIINLLLSTSVPSRVMVKIKKELYRK